MISTELYQLEIDTINYFLEEVSSIALVESIYLVPYYDRIENNCCIEVVAICNESIHYNELLTGYSNEMRYTKNDTNRLLNIVNKDMCYLLNNIKENSIKERLNFRIENSDDYHLSRKTSKSHRLAKELVSSTILFDRFGNKKKQRTFNLEGINSVNKAIHPYDNIIIITNIYELLETKKEQTKTKLT